LKKAKRNVDDSFESRKTPYKATPLKSYLNHNKDDEDDEENQEKKEKIETLKITQEKKNQRETL